MERQLVARADVGAQEVGNEETAAIGEVAGRLFALRFVSKTKPCRIVWADSFADSTVIFIPNAA